MDSAEVLIVAVAVGCMEVVVVPAVVVDSVPEVVVAVVLRSVEVVLLANVVDSVVVMLIDVVGDFLDMVMVAIVVGFVILFATVAGPVEVMMVAAVDSSVSSIKFSVCFDGGHCGWFSGSGVDWCVDGFSRSDDCSSGTRFSRSCSGSV